jgi:hypothetical protein
MGSAARNRGVTPAIRAVLRTAGLIVCMAGVFIPRPAPAGAGIGAAAEAAPRSTLPVLVPEPAARALAAIGWQPEDLRFDRDDVNLYGGGPYRLPLYDAWIDHPFLIPPDVNVFQRSIFAGARPSDWSVFAGLRIGRGVRRGLLSDPAQALADSLAKEARPLRRALEEVWRAAGSDPPQESRIQSAEEALLRLPAAWQRPLALILSGEASAARWRNTALAPCPRPPQELYRESIRYVLGLDSDAQDPAFQRSFEEAAGAIDLSLLQAGTTDLLLCLESAVAQLEAALHDARPGTAAFDLLRPILLDTPLGLIRIGSTGDDEVPAGDYLLIVDPAGDDRYHGGASGTPASPVSVLCDLSGDDRYVASDSTRPEFGAGITGIGVLFDRAGNDQYHAMNLSLGAGLCGSGLLWDGGGDDLYDAITGAQGAGFFGFGILADQAGRDRYHAFQQAQGFGYTLGCGLLLDASGDDEYTAEDTVIRFPSAQSKEHNSSLAQGFGFGKRADFSDGLSLAGGFGLLCDGGGNDRYRCGVFGQGSGYWYGIGVLADAAGNDSYEGVWYTQGAAAHFALGVLWDGGGDDHYRSTMNMAQGAGHDFSLGLLYDQSGSDEYQAPNLSLGGGNANGFGIFWDVTGDDRYQVDAAVTLGRSNVASRGGLRDRMKNLGLFLDTGGHDQYPDGKPFAGNGRLWTQTGTDQKEPLATEAGVGLDTE